jgi:predicted RNase H-like nuclease
MRVVGVDGCPGGWLAVAYDDAQPALVPWVHATFPELLAAYPDAACIGIDIPIGLSSNGPRPCDVEARRVLGPRKSSVFPAPDARLLGVASYAEANALSRALTGQGHSRQAFAILAKIAEVNQAMTPALQRRVIEVHPEVSFWALAGRPMEHRKGAAAGFAERRALLEAAFPGLPIPTRQQAAALARPATPDDVLDAMVVAWTARRFAAHHAGRLTLPPPTTDRALRMEIVF